MGNYPGDLTGKSQFRTETLMMHITKRLIIALVIVLAPGSSEAATKAEILAAIYGSILGHADQCGFTIKAWHARRMGLHIARVSVSEANKERAIETVHETQAIVSRSPTMTCEEARAALKHSENELR